MISNQEPSIVVMTKKEQQFLDAAISGNLRVIAALLKGGVDVDVQDTRGLPTNRTALMHAAENGHLEVVSFLIESGARVNSIDKGVPIDCPGGNTALILAIRNGHSKVAHRLLDAGASPKTKGGGTSVINAAAYFGEEGLVQRLIDLGADPRQRDGSGFCPIASALNNRNSNVVSLLLDMGIDPNSQSPGGSPIMRDAVYNGDIKICRMLIDKGANPELADRDGFTPLMMACAAVKVDAVRFLLSLQVAVNKQDNQGRTALDIIRRQLEPDGFSPEVRQRLIKLGQYQPAPIKELRAIAVLLLRAGGKTGKENILCSKN